MIQGRSKIARTVVVRHDASSLTRGPHGVLERSLIGLGEVVTHFDVRYIELPPAGVASAHSHEWEQATYVLDGRCKVTADGKAIDLGPRDFVFFEGGVHHEFVNASDAETVVLLAVRGPR